MISRKFFIMLAAGAAFLGAGCVKKAAEPVTINIGSLYEPSNLSNTGGGGQGVTEAFNGNVYEALFKLTDSGTIENSLAKEYRRSEDGLAYTITLREGLRFHSGKKLSSADVRASFERVTAPDSLAARRSSYAIISAIDTPDEQTVVFTLTKPSVSLPYTLSYVWIVNTENTDLRVSEDGTGPYTLENWARGSSLSLVKWNDYWGSAAKNDRVVFHYFTDANALNNALLSGQVDVITSVQNPDAIARFENNERFTINNGSSTTKELLAFNDRVKPFDTVMVRKAVYSAINREKLLNAIWGNYGMLIGSIVPPSDPWYDSAVLAENPYNIELAKTLLAGAGYAEGFSFTLDTPVYDPHPAVAEFIQSELAKVGITVRINPISADEWYSKVFRNKDFEATLQEHVNDRDIVWYGNPDFYWGYRNDEVISLTAGAEAAATETEQTEKLLAVNHIIAKEAASVWLYLYPQIVIASSRLSGYPVNGLNAQFFAYNIEKR